MPSYDAEVMRRLGKTGQTLPGERGRRRVCVIRQYYYPSCSRVRREVKALVDHGYSVDVLCLGRPNEPVRERIGNVEIHRLRLIHRRQGIPRYVFEYSAFFLWAFARTSWLHLKRPYAVVQVNTLPDPLVFAAAVPKLLGAGIVLDMHEVMPELYVSKFGGTSKSLPFRAVALAERWSAAFADRVITVSKPTRTVLVGRGISLAKLEIVMNSADESIFIPQAENGSSKTRSKQKQLTLVSHGMLIERYGFQTIIRALLPISKAFPNVRLLVVGEGEHEPALRELARKLNLENHVSFEGYRAHEQVVEIVRSADIGITANRKDEFTPLIVPTKLMEYVTLGLPAVVARHAAVEEYFDDGMVHYFEPDDPGDLASVVCSVAGDLEGARVRATRTSKIFVRKYGWETMKQRYVGLVDDVASGRPTGRFSQT
jgi:glycosyltransferase involved in cell wall biosynthesis